MIIIKMSKMNNKNKQIKNEKFFFYKIQEGIRK